MSLESNRLCLIKPELLVGNESDYDWTTNLLIIAKDYAANVTLDSTLQKTEGYRPVLVALASVLVLMILYANLNPKCLDEKRLRQPHRASYSLPFIGHLAQVAWGRTEFVSSLGPRWNRQPVEIRLMGWGLCVLSAPDHIAALFKNPRSSGPRQTLPYLPIMARNGFGAPKGSTDRHKLVEETATTPPHFALHKEYVKEVAMSLSGGNLVELAARFQNEFLTMIRSAPIHDDWVHQSDLYPFVRHLFFRSATNSMCGRQLLRDAPGLEEDFWTFNSNLWYLIASFPRWLARTGWTTRDRCLATVESWLRWLSDNDADWTNSAAALHVDYPHRLIRASSKYWDDRIDMNEKIHSADMLGLIWGINANAAPLGFWAVFEVVRRPALLQRVQQEVMRARLPEPTADGLEFDVAELCRNPLLQSIYAEAARLYVHAVHNRGLQDDLQIGPWTFKRNKFILISTYWVHRDPETWNTGTGEDPHPVDEFWAERFLIDPSNPHSGPLKPQPSRIGGEQHAPKAVHGSLRFSLDGLSSMWLPYGGGESICPGRFFAKQEILLGIAMIITHFDIELLPGYTTELDTWQLGIGTTTPRGSAPFRVRRRL